LEINMSKGSKRRPSSVEKEKLEENWEKIFGEEIEVTFVNIDDYDETEIEFVPDEAVEAMIMKRFSREH
tara:strand:+ start:345 stop:551 length:207 start_codon:yes stop_codon:yes gene_type:complete